MLNLAVHIVTTGP